MDWTLHCANCYLDLRRMKRNSLSMQNNEVRTVIQEWILPQAVDQHSVVCDACLRAAIHNVVKTPGTSQPARHVGHRHVCVCCGQSVLRQRSHRLRTDTDRERHIMNVAAHRIQPRRLRSTDLICHPCWQQCDQAASPPTSLGSQSPASADVSQQEEEPQMRSVILLPNYVLRNMFVFSFKKYII